MSSVIPFVQVDTNATIQSYNFSVIGNEINGSTQYFVQISENEGGQQHILTIASTRQDTDYVYFVTQPLKVVDKPLANGETVNYVQYEFALDVQQYNLIWGNCTVGFNVENSWIQYDQLLVLNQQIYDQLTSNFSKAFGACVNVNKFLFNSSKLPDRKTIIQAIRALIATAPLKQNAFEAIDWKQKYFVSVEMQEGNELMSVMLQTLLDGQFVTYNPSSSQSFDLMIKVKSSLEEVEQDSSSNGNTICVVAQTTYATTVQLIRKLQAMTEQLTSQNIPDREAEIKKQKEAFVEMMKQQMSKSQCSGPKEDGGCCGGGCGGAPKQEEEKKEEEKKESGCKGCKTAGGCKSTSCTPTGCSKSDCCKKQ